MTTPFTACPHCGSLMPKRVLPIHAPVCLSDPAVMERARAALSDPANPGHAVTPTAYRDRARELGAPSRYVLTARWGTWAAAVKALGLDGAATKRASCPHCGLLLSSHNHQLRHAATCSHNLAVRVRILAALTDPDAPGVAVGRADYRDAHEATGAPSGAALVQRYGSWANVCAAFDLQPATQRKPNGSVDHGPAVDEHERMLAEAARIRQAERDYHGLQTCSERVLPDGRIARMVR